MCFLHFVYPQEVWLETNAVWLSKIEVSMNWKFSSHWELQEPTNYPILATGHLGMSRLYMWTSPGQSMLA